MLYFYLTLVLLSFFKLGNALPDVRNLRRNANHESTAVNEGARVAHPGVTVDEKAVVTLSGNKTRRILKGKDVQSNDRPYMVYLQLTAQSAKAHRYNGWLCGGVVVHKWYVMTSAACVEDAERFYVVSGTREYVEGADFRNNECVSKNRRRVTWKCVPKNYQFDIDDSVKWSTNDIAIVKVEKPFHFGRLERGCDFAVDAISYNNVSKAAEKPKTKGFVAGWGSKGAFRKGAYRRQKSNRPENSKTLQEASVEIIDKKDCAKRWAPKFRKVIQEYMICTKQNSDGMSEVCNKKYANCTELNYDVAKGNKGSDSDGSGGSNERGSDDGGNSDAGSGGDDGQDVDFRAHVDAGRHLRHPERPRALRRSAKNGGFCENDHGGPLIVKQDGKDTVVGIISACKINPKTHGCQGPFLYTSVFNNRQFISCSIYKNEQPKCRRVFRAGIDHEEYHVSWKDNNEDEEEINASDN